jgi:hypothetical protein
MEIPFEIGKTYANRDGSYEVVHLDAHSGTMIIRYLDSGDELEKDITFQARIWNNMQLEEQEAARRSAEEDARYQKGYGEAFVGLKEAEFKTSTEGTTWRSRAGLAGRVALLASEGTPYTFVSWSIYRWPVAFLTHREDYEMAAFEMGTRKAKFTLEIDNHSLYYGFYVEKGDMLLDHEWDWPRLVQRLSSNEALRNILICAEKEHGARFIGRQSQGDERFHFANGPEMGSQSLWDEQVASNLSIDERLAALQEIPIDHWGEIYVIGTMQKQHAIELEIDVAKPITEMFKALLPIYEAAVKAG